ncbi:hypothetical protein A33M_1323 [Rhodovulum sp. PH10]|uniref:phasin family protein n=1 Tax=Rhodovulum sp. PH10 TaxID=1187851 RepID=UPI00027C29CC|nr:phasin family protein [Rhodovulum sp. PH10]EJW12979.1 hypothetical protein A33M_1323 [Rhodovulum sp. PH10]
MDQQVDEQRRVAEDTARKVSEQTERIGQASAAVNERAAKASAEMLKHGAEAMQDAIQSGSRLASDIARHSADQFSKALGLSGDGVQQAAERTTANVDAIVESSSILTEMTKQVTKAWMDFTGERLEQNFDRAGRLLQCRTPQEMISIQSEIMRANLESWLDCTRRIAEKSVHSAEQAMQRAEERIDRGGDGTDRPGRGMDGREPGMGGPERTEASPPTAPGAEPSREPQAAH